MARSTPLLLRWCFLLTVLLSFVACRGAESESEDVAEEEQEQLEIIGPISERPTPGTCESPPTVSGVLQNDISAIDFTGEEVIATIEHKLDIDPEEDGCIAHAEFRVRKAGLGCELFLELGTRDGGQLELVEASLSADSFCPSWSDDDEGTYELVEEHVMVGLVTHVAHATAEQSCMGSIEVAFFGTILLQSGDRELQVDLGTIGFVGDFMSTGNTDLQCPCIPECTSRRCGPDPVCGASCGECGDHEECDLETGACECVPDCSELECGPDPRCGASCGGCSDGEVCNNNTGQCGCEPDCSDRDCGPDPRCGVSCGDCSDGEECNVDVGKCSCRPDCDGRECGGDGCGGTCGDCSGTCTDGVCELGDLNCWEVLSCISECTSDSCTSSCIGAVCEGSSTDWEYVYACATSQCPSQCDHLWTEECSECVSSACSTDVSWYCQLSGC